MALFNWFQGQLSDEHEHSTYNSLYGALVQSTGTSVNLKLCLPELSDLSGPREMRIPTFTGVWNLDVFMHCFAFQ